MSEQLCPCGSGLECRELFDVRGESCTLVCDKCETDLLDETSSYLDQAEDEEAH